MVSYHVCILPVVKQLLEPTRETRGWYPVCPMLQEKCPSVNRSITAGMNLMMHQAEEIKMWIVSGQLSFVMSPDRADYSFTLVEYQLYIDEVP